MQSQSHLHMRDDGHGNLENGNSSSPSNAESSSPVTTNSSKQKSSMQLSTSSATSTSTMPSTAPAPHPQSSHKPSYTHSMTNDPNHDQNQNQSNSPTNSNTNNKTQFLLEQQIKMTQLHQLQQLQNHIFQQQMALISGQATPMSTVLPGSTSSELVGVRGGGAPIQGPGAVVVRPLQSLHGEQNLAQGLQSHGGEIQSGSRPHNFSGLPTPAPSGEIRPMDYNTASPMMNLIGSLNLQHIEPLPNSMIPSSNPSMRSPPQYPNLSQPNPNISQRYGHRHSSSLSLPPALQNNRQSHASYPSSPSTFNQISPTFQPISPMHLPILHPYHRPSNSHHPSSRTMSQMQAPWHSHPSSSPSTPISAHSERIDFNVYGVDTNRNGGSLHATPHLHPGSSVHTSPSILGSGVGSINGHSGGFGHGQQLLDLDQDISPLTSPWLGATVSGSGGTAVSTLAQIASNPAGPPLLQKVEAASNAAHARRTSVSGNKRTASESGDEGDDAWSRGGTNRSSRKRPVLGNGGRTGSVGSNANAAAAAAPGLVGSEKEKGGERNDEGRNSGSTSPLTRNSTSPASEMVSSPTSLVKDPLAREGGSGGHVNGCSSHAPPTPLITTSMGGPSRRTGKGSRSTTSTPLLRSTPPATNLLSPMSPFSGVGGGGTGSGRRESRSNLLGVGGKGHGQDLKSPSPVDLNLEGGQGQDGKNGRSMPPPPLPRGGVDVDMNSTEPTSPMDDSTGHSRDGMLGMGGMSFDSMMSLDEGMNVGMVGMGMSGLGGMGMGGLDGMSGMDMESMGGIGSMSMEEMGVGMGMNMGGMGGFGSSHEDSGMMGMGYGRDHEDEGGHISSSSSSARTNGGMTLATHQQHRPQSHLQPHSEYQQGQSHLSPAQTQHSRPLSHHLHSAQMHELQNEQNKHQDQLGQSITGNQPNQQQQPIMPVATPSSILNLGRIGGGSGGRLGSALSASTSMGAANAALKSDGTGVVPRAKKPTKASKDGGGSNGGSGASRKRSLTASMVGLGTGVGVSPALKPLRPAVVAVSESTLPSPVLTGSIGPSSLTSKAPASGISGTAAGSTGGGGSITATPILGPADAIGVIRQPKRTHRDAEQRRRNSQKQVIDELRRLLPPIALPNDSNATGDAADLASSLGLPGTSPFFFQPTATLLPGGLPPRGPPKVGGEGPNKNVSKLQVLLCGNEYIKLLKGRVDRRDDEIGRLRREVRRLRGLRLGGGVRGGDDEEIGEEVDLEKDLDAVERLQMMSGKGTGSSAGESSVQGRGSSGNDPMDEDDDDGDD